MTEWQTFAHRAVRAELKAAVDYYSATDWRSANAFNAAFIAAVEAIPVFPYSRREYVRGWRRIVISKYPYMIIYAVRRKNIYIVTLQHMSRAPAHIRKTIRDRPTTSSDYKPFAG